MKPGELAEVLLNIEGLAVRLVGSQVEDAVLEVLRATVRDLWVLADRLGKVERLPVYCAPGCPLCDVRRAS